MIEWPAAWFEAHTLGPPGSVASFQYDSNMVHSNCQLTCLTWRRCHRAHRKRKLNCLLVCQGQLFSLLRHSSFAMIGCQGGHYLNRLRNFNLSWMALSSSDWIGLASGHVKTPWIRRSGSTSRMPSWVHGCCPWFAFAGGWYLIEDLVLFGASFCQASFR